MIAQMIGIIWLRLDGAIYDESGLSIQQNPRPDVIDYRKVIEIIGGQGRIRTADAGLFRAAYRIAEVV